MAQAAEGRSSGPLATLVRKLRSAGKLGLAGGLRTGAAATVLVPVCWSLRWAGFNRTFRWLGQTSPAPRPDLGENEPSSGEELQRLAHRWSRALDIAGRNLPVRGKCLERSLALWWILRWRGVAPELRLGVRRGEEPGKPLDAHAWLETRGRVLNDRPDVAERFAPFSGALTQPSSPEGSTRDATVSGPR